MNAAVALAARATSVTRTYLDAMLAALNAHVPLQRTVLHEGQSLYASDDRFHGLHVPNSGSFKTLGTRVDGQRQIVSLHWRGDWLGLEAIATGRQPFDVIALETSEVWTFHHEPLMRACLDHPSLLPLVHEAMSRAVSTQRESLLTLRTLPATARVAEFVRSWGTALADRGLRNDRMLMRLSRAEIANFLGLTVETVSRSLSQLDGLGLIEFLDPGRREIHVPNDAALAAFIRTAAL